MTPKTLKTRNKVILPQKKLNVSDFSIVVQLSTPWLGEKY